MLLTCCCLVSSVLMRHRYVTPRYFPTSEEFKKAQEEVNGWNIARRPDDDNNRAFWDKDDAIVALTRSKASFWLKPSGIAAPTSPCQIIPSGAANCGLYFAPLHGLGLGQVRATVGLLDLAQQHV